MYRVLVVRPEGKRPLGRPRRRWEDNIKMDLREVGTLARASSVRSLASMQYLWARSENYEKRLLASSCPSDCPHGITWFPLDGFS